MYLASAICNLKIVVYRAQIAGESPSPLGVCGILFSIGNSLKIDAKLVPEMLTKRRPWSYRLDPQFLKKLQNHTPKPISENILKKLPNTP